MDPLLLLLVMTADGRTLIEHEKFLMIVIHINFKNLFGIQSFVFALLMHNLQSLLICIFHILKVECFFRDDSELISDLLNLNRT